MKKRKIYSILAFIVIMVLTISACAKKGEFKDTSDNTASTTAEGGAEAPSVAYDMVANQESKSTVDFDTANGSNLTSNYVISSKEKETASQDKIIRRVNMDVETQNFDDLINTIDSKINLLGGYVESSSIAGKRYYYSNESLHGNITARIPNDKLDEFIDIVNENANVVNKDENTENVTLEYIDVESRKKSLEIEQERLFVLLEKTDTLENIITLESRLSDIRYQLQSYATQLRTYDNLVEYSTVTLTITEVERITPVTEEKKTVWNRINTGFGDTMYNLSEGLKNFMVWFVVNLPYLIIWAGIITGIILIVRRYFKKKKIKEISASMPPKDEKKA